LSRGITTGRAARAGVRFLLAAVFVLLAAAFFPAVPLFFFVPLCVDRARGTWPPSRRSSTSYPSGDPGIVPCGLSNVESVAAEPDGLRQVVRFG
jgi:hypothetical protein